MASSLSNVAMARAVGKLPGLRNIPLARLVLLAEVAILAKAHFERLKPSERRRLFVLLRDARLRPSNLSDRQRKELEGLLVKLEPKRFAMTALERFSPIPLHRHTDS